MNAYSEAFYRYVSERPLKIYDVDIESVLELFYKCYAEGALKDTPEMKTCIKRVYELTSPQVGDELLYAISEITLAGEKQAFMEGIRVGGKWIMEIMRIPCKNQEKLV